MGDTGSEIPKATVSPLFIIIGFSESISNKNISKRLFMAFYLTIYIHFYKNYTLYSISIQQTIYLVLLVMWLSKFS
jgi:branched-subunit amino acid transport protein AzlD